MPTQQTRSKKRDILTPEEVRGAFIEGKPVYPRAGLYDKTHIQICVIRNVYADIFYRKISNKNLKTD